ncbi:MAG: N-acetyl-gamma-glutamyl-phosphate reductase [Proteobacteria bacterium]|nr:N-acetyl-gamma-glutamyl-phosphate reductase [Pseudomonadota bacterium]
MIKAIIIGGSGYTGAELLRLLALHPDVTVVAVTSRQYSGVGVTEVYPALAGYYNGLKYLDPAEIESMECDVLFSALPHGVSQASVLPFVESGVKVVDLSADFRLHDAAVYEKWYCEHTAPGLLDKAVYGLPELHREAIKETSLVANPGCFPTGALLALSPIMKNGLCNAGMPVVIDSKSGVTGAGRKAAIETSFVTINEGFKAYKIGEHRHTPEMAQELSALAGADLNVTFTPHLLPVSRGILTTAYVWLNETVTPSALHGLYKEMYEGEPFVRVMAPGHFPDISQVRGSNYCDIGLYIDEQQQKVVVVSAIDNLVKGASGAAVQNMNLLFGLDETTSLTAAPLSI